MSQQLDAVRAFHRIPIFRSLSDEETYEIIRTCSMRKLPQGHLVFKQGEPGNSLFVIAEGQIGIILEREDGGQEVMAFLGQNDVLGEVSVINPAPRSATARVVVPTTVYELKGDDFQHLVRAMRPAAYKLIRALSRLVCNRIRAVNERIEAELVGGPKPPPMTGEFEQLRKTGDYRTATGSRVGVGSSTTRVSGGRPGVDTDENKQVGMFGRWINKIFGSGDKP